MRKLISVLVANQLLFATMEYIVRLVWFGFMRRCAYRKYTIHCVALHCIAVSCCCSVCVRTVSGTIWSMQLIMNNASMFHLRCFDVLCCTLCVCTYAFSILCTAYYQLLFRLILGLPLSKCTPTHPHTQRETLTCESNSFHLMAHSYPLPATLCIFGFFIHCIIASRCFANWRFKRLEWRARSYFGDVPPTASCHFSFYAHGPLILTPCQNKPKIIELPHVHRDQAIWYATKLLFMFIPHSAWVALPGFPSFYILRQLN